MSVVALVGLPNAGKSSLFNALTGSSQRVANFPGITVDKKVGFFESNDKKFELIDLPGLYTLDAINLDEKITRDFILNKRPDKSEKADFFILVVDATNLKKSLYLALQMKATGQKFVVAMNMIDQADRRKLKLDFQKLSIELGISEIIPTCAIDKVGITEIISAVEKVSLEKTPEISISPTFQKEIKSTKYIKDMFKKVDEILGKVVINKLQSDSFTERVDSIVLHPILGPVILMAVLIFTFQMLFAWADPFVGYIEAFFSLMGHFVKAVVPVGHFQSLLVDGVIAGVGGVLVFLPHIIFLFVLIYFLEDFGYLGRVAFLLDYLMRKVGLPGKAVVPLLSSHACAIPGIMSARIIENPIQRMITILISPLAACSARLPVYTLLIAVIVPNEKIFGLFGLPGLVLFALYMFGMLSAFIVSFVASKAYAQSSPAYLMMELPPYRIPKVWTILKGAFYKGYTFVEKAGTVILVLSVLIWFLVTFPQAPKNANQPAINYSAAAVIGKSFEPIFKPIGFDWKITTALIPSFGAREVLVAAMGTVYAVEGDDSEDTGFVESLSSILNTQYSLATLMSLLVWFIFSPQCIATFAVMRKETGGWKLPIIFGLYTLGLAYFFSFITYNLFL